MSSINGAKVLSSVRPSFLFFLSPFFFFKKGEERGMGWSSPGAFSFPPFPPPFFSPFFPTSLLVLVFETDIGQSGCSFGLFVVMLTSPPPSSLLFFSFFSFFSPGNVGARFNNMVNKFTSATCLQPLDPFPPFFPFFPLLFRPRPGGWQGQEIMDPAAQVTSSSPHFRFVLFSSFFSFFPYGA